MSDSATPPPDPNAPPVDPNAPAPAPTPAPPVVLSDDALLVLAEDKAKADLAAAQSALLKAQTDAQTAIASATQVVTDKTTAEATASAALAAKVFMEKVVVVDNGDGTARVLLSDSATAYHSLTGNIVKLS